MLYRIVSFSGVQNGIYVTFVFPANKTSTKYWKHMLFMIQQQDIVRCASEVYFELNNFYFTGICFYIRMCC